MSSRYWKSGRCRRTERRAERTNGRLRRPRQETARTADEPARRGACRGQRNEMSEATATRASAGLRPLANMASLPHQAAGCASGPVIPHRAFVCPLHFASYPRSGAVYETKMPPPQMSLLQKFFRPDHRSRNRQRYCSDAECQKASKALSQHRWHTKPENRDYWRGTQQVDRVRAWRAAQLRYRKQAACETSSVTR